MVKKKYYVSLQSREISQVKAGNNHHFIIHATEDEVQQLRRKLTEIYDAELDTYWRAHLPFVAYHKDLSNDRYDESFTDALKMVYRFGDEQTKDYINSTGVFRDRPLDTR